MARINVAAVMMGATRLVKLIGQTKTGVDHDIENVTAEVVSNPEGCSVTIDEADPTLLRIAGLAEGSASIKVTADGRIGEGVRPIEKMLSVVIVPPDAVDIVFEDLGDAPDAPAAGDQGGGGAAQP